VPRPETGGDHIRAGNRTDSPTGDGAGVTESGRTV